eukprot:gnl/TRDRNA2_/TRDRNA2_156325_c1_seq2.p1 gnl/TRDRNA2_/TRDRNA2_156325_c1~~gnl/TRDRNA2_/TRDRNA2_156325_c1_seq2.p1  ORF type:complete len:194 (-),score=24.43 gnl/TRDRNA2_/TRDRNA2_156325_c1_seq2:121-615(-)
MNYDASLLIGAGFFLVCLFCLLPGPFEDLFAVVAKVLSFVLRPVEGVADFLALPEVLPFTIILAAGALAYLCHIDPRRGCAVASLLFVASVFLVYKATTAATVAEAQRDSSVLLSMTTLRPAVQSTAREVHRLQVKDMLLRLRGAGKHIEGLQEIGFRSWSISS